MTLETILIILILLVIAVLQTVLLMRKPAPPDTTESKQMTDLLMTQMNEMNKTLRDSQHSMNESVQSQFGNSQKLIQDVNQSITKHLVDVTKGVAEANEASKQIFGIADQLQDLEKTLKHQKQRGNLGEASLELILSNMLPPTEYKMQHTFTSGEAVDAIINTRAGIIPIDAKFSLDNYQRVTNAVDDISRAQYEREFRNDMKKRIDETAKYIRPNEGTLSFAFMYIPAEGIYYDLLVNKIGSVKGSERSLIDYANHEKKVIIVSPTTFAAYLQSVLYGFKAFKIEESAQEIRKYVGELQKHLQAYEEYHTKLGNTLGTAVNHYNRTGKEFKKIDKDVLKITGSSIDADITLIDKPNMEE